MFKGFSFYHTLRILNLTTKRKISESSAIPNPMQQLKKQSDVNNGENGGHQYSGGIQQDDNYKDFMGWITDGGLRHAYAMKHGNSENLYQKKVDKEHKRHVIIVGAGMAGLSAAYELAQIGHTVTILEVQSRVGGRVKTIREGFTEGLHSEGGAMRLPPNHYLTWHYLNLFGVETVPFQNYNENGYLYLFGKKIRMHDWKKNNKKYSDELWPGWDKNLTEEDKAKYKIDGILSYYEATMKPIKDELGPSPLEKKWHDWLRKWSKLSTEEFLRGFCADEMKCSPLTPWTEQAIECYKVSTYTPTFGTDIATHLREDLGKWWQDFLKTPKLGMDTLPKAFTRKNENGWNPSVDLSKHIKFGIMVTKVENVEHVKDKKAKMVKVTGENTSTGHKETFEGDAVILTLPLQILRQLDIPFSIEKQKAISEISYAASTKIMLQCKKRFWQKDVAHGGFSKTDMMIGQLHYPDGSGIGDNERGVLMVYTWQDNALAYGSQPKDLAIRSAVHDISKIHPEIKHEFEVGTVQAWYSDPTSQGAFANLKPYEYIDHMKSLTQPTDTVYLAGEALSWSNGWIQGAIFSGLMQAYCFQSHQEDKEIVTPVSLMLGKK